MTGYDGSIGGEAGLYFWGILEGAGTYDFSFQLVKRDAQRKFAVSSYSKTAAGKTVGGNVAFKIGGFKDNGNFVSLGYAGSPLWATGNLDKTHAKIVHPLDAGEYFMYGKTTPYNQNDEIYGGDELQLFEENDVAYRVNSAWRIPSEEQFLALISSSNTSNTWVEGWSKASTARRGRIFTSKANGISLFFAALGYYNQGVLDFADVAGYYWTSTCFYLEKGDTVPWSLWPITIQTPIWTSPEYALFLRFDSDGLSSIKKDWLKRFLGFQVRPVRN